MRQVVKKGKHFFVSYMCFSLNANVRQIVIVAIHPQSSQIIKKVLWLKRKDIEENHIMLVVHTVTCKHRLYLFIKPLFYLVERRRRNNINDNIKSLGQLLPDNMREGKLNKGSILKGSVVYIHMLNEQLSQYKEKLERLQYEAANISSVAAASSV